MLNSARFAAMLATAALSYAPASAHAQTCEDLVLGAALSATGIYASTATTPRTATNSPSRRSTTPAA